MKQMMERFFRYTLPVLFVVLLLTGIISSVIFQNQLRNQLVQSNLKLLQEVKTDLDVMLAPQEKFKLIDTDKGYLARIQPALLYGRVESVPEVQSLASAQRFLTAAKSGEGVVHSIYVTICGPDTSYVLTDSGLQHKKFLSDKDWLTTIDAQPIEDFCEFRTIPMGAAEGGEALRVITVYHRIQSIHWDTQQPIDGYVVINYYLMPITMQLMRTLPNSHSIYLVEAQNGQFFVSGHDDVLTEEELLSLTIASKQVGKVKNSNGEFVYFRSSSDKLSVDYILLCPSKILFQLVSDLNLAMLLLTGSLIALSLLFFLVYQYQQRKYLTNIRHLIAMSGEADTPRGMFRFPRGDYDSIARYILNHTGAHTELNIMLQKEQATRMEMEMLALQSQINPHFLLNTIDFLYWGQVRDFGLESTQVHMMENLCRILKYALDSSHTIVPLRDELAQTTYYIEIQKARKNFHLDISYQIPEDLMDAGVMKLILQPILENAFEHGLRLENKKQISICIAAKPEGEYLLLCVSDSGIGMNANERMRINKELRKGIKSKSHIGMANINRRLMLSYGEDAGIFLDDTPVGGLSVTLKMRFATYNPEEYGF